MNLLAATLFIAAKSIVAAHIPDANAVIANHFDSVHI